MFRFIFIFYFFRFFVFFPRRVQQKHICRFFFTFFSLYFRFVFALFSFFFRFFFFCFSLFVLLCFCFLLCFRFVFAFSFAFILFFHFFHKKYLMVGHVWLPSPNISLAPLTSWLREGLKSLTGPFFFGVWDHVLQFLYPRLYLPSAG